MERFNADKTLTAGERNEMPAKEFAGPDGVLPIDDEDHVRAAMSRFGQVKGLSADQRKTAFNKIVAKAKKLGIDPSGFVEKWGDRLDSMDEEDDYDDEDDEDDDEDDQPNDEVVDDAPTGKKKNGKGKSKRGDSALTYMLPAFGQGTGAGTNTQLTTVVDGHQHTIDVTRGWNETSYALKPGDETSHNHVWTRAADGSIEIAENDGHTHEVEPLEETQTSPEFNMRGDQGAAAMPKKPETTTTTTTSTMNLDEAVRSLEAQLTNARKELETVTEERDRHLTRADQLKGELDIALKRIPELQAQLGHIEAARETAAIRKESTRATRRSARSASWSAACARASRRALRSSARPARSWARRSAWTTSTTARSARRSCATSTRPSTSATTSARARSPACSTR